MSDLDDFFAKKDKSKKKNKQVIAPQIVLEETNAPAVVGPMEA
jgi:hypothetical protein